MNKNDELLYELLISRDGDSFPMRVLLTAALAQMNGSPARYVAPVELWSTRKLQLIETYGLAASALDEAEMNLQKTGFGKLVVVTNFPKLQQINFQSF